jgi:error-prone DNA polymerase
MIFLTLEDEFGHTPLIVKPSVFKIYRTAIMESLITVHGKVSRIKGTMNVDVEHIDIIPRSPHMPPAKNWK